MNRKFTSILKKAVLLSGVILSVSIAHAQSATDTTRHHNGMHRNWSDNRKDGDNWASHRPGQSNIGGGRNGFRGRGEHRNWGRGAFAHNRERIHYTPEQRRQVAAINKEYHQKSADLFKKDNITLREYKSSLVALQKEKKSKLEGLLTQQQKDERTASRKRMAENTQVMAAARLERLRIRLNLSDDQITKIKAGQESLHSQFKAIHENDDLLPQQKMEQMKSLMAKRNDTFKSVLTPDQYTQFEKMSHHQPGGPGGWQGRRSS